MSETKGESSTMTPAEQHTIKVSHAIMGMLGLVLAFLLGLITITWNAASTLTQMKDQISDVQSEQLQEKQDMQAVKALLWAPVVQNRKH